MIDSTLIPSLEILHTSTIRSTPFRSRMNSKQTSPCSRMEQTAFLVRCRVGFSRSVVSAGVNRFRPERFLFDCVDLESRFVWHWQVS